MKRIALGFALALPLAAAADKLDCTIKATKRTSLAEMNALAKVTEADARKTALASVNAPKAGRAKGGLGVEDGCLVYAYDITFPGKSGAEEVLIDAGTGKVLVKEHESAAKEAAEKAADKAAGKK